MHSIEKNMDGDYRLHNIYYLYKHILSPATARMHTLLLSELN